MGLLLPPTCISGQSNPCLNCSSAALLRESKDSLLEMDVMLPLGAAVVLLTPSVRHHSPTYVRRQEIHGKSVVWGTSSRSGNTEVTLQPPARFALSENGNPVRSTHPHAVGRSRLPDTFTRLREAPVLPARRSGLLSFPHGAVARWLWD